MIGVYFHKERCATLQIDPQTYASHRCFLDAVENGGRRANLVRIVELWEITADVIGANGFLQVLILPVRARGAQVLSFRDDFAKGFVRMAGIFAENLD